MQAVIQYGKIVSWLEMEYGLSEKELKASESFLLAAFLNLAMCYLKLREYAKAVECCDKVKAPLTDGRGEPGFASPPPKVAGFPFCIVICVLGLLSINWEIQKDSLLQSDFP